MASAGALWWARHLLRVDVVVEMTIPLIDTLLIPFYCAGKANRRMKMRATLDRVHSYRCCHYCMVYADVVAVVVVVVKRPHCCTATFLAAGNKVVLLGVLHHHNRIGECHTLDKCSDAVAIHHHTVHNTGMKG